MITLTEKAIEKIKEIAESEGLPLSIRIKILGSGCSGFQFDMTFEDKYSDMDETLKINEIQLIIDQMSFQYISGINIHYEEFTFGGGFKFSGGEIKSSCGCGNSYEF